MRLSKYIQVLNQYDIKKILYKKINFVKKLGNGSTGTVYKVLIDKKYYVAKIFDIDNYIYVKDMINEVHNEIHISSLLNETYNCNNIHSYSIYNRLDKVNIYLISKYYNNSNDLRRFMNNNFKEEWNIEINKRIQIIKQIVNGLNELHKNNIIHSDIKLENIIIYKKKETFNIKIIDYGSCCHLDKEDVYFDASDYDYHFGTIGYMPSEVYYTKKIYYLSDIYSLFVCILELIIGKIWSNIKNETFKSCIDDINVGLKKIDNSVLKYYFDKCLSLNKSNRFNIQYIINNFNIIFEQLI